MRDESTQTSSCTSLIRAGSLYIKICCQVESGADHLISNFALHLLWKIKSGADRFSLYLPTIICINIRDRTLHIKFPRNCYNFHNRTIRKNIHECQKSFKTFSSSRPKFLSQYFPSKFWILSNSHKIYETILTFDLNDDQNLLSFLWHHTKIFSHMCC